MSLMPIGIIAASGAASGSLELISTTVLASATSSVTFSSIPQTYKHLMIRYSARSDNSGGTSRVASLRFNGDTAGNYADHRFGNNGTTVTSVTNTSQTAVPAGYMTGSTATANVFGAGVIDILDYTATTKNKTVRSLNGYSVSSNNFVHLMSGVWANTAAITSITFADIGYNLAAGTRVSLYGIKG
jgi:hypothetical protein